VESTNRIDKKRGKLPPGGTGVDKGCFYMWMACSRVREFGCRFYSGEEIARAKLRKQVAREKLDISLLCAWRAGSFHCLLNGYGVLKSAKVNI